MAVIVRPAYGPDDEVFADGVDWDIDRDRDLNIYDRPLSESPEYPLATFRDGQWCRVMRDAPPPAQA